MKKMLFLASFLIASCSTSLKIIQPQGKYPAPPIITTSSKSFDQVWDGIIDFFAQNGVPIKIIDKSSGLIISEQNKLKWSYEKPDGSLYLPSAYAVLPKIMKPMSSTSWYSPENVTGEWNVRIKKMSDGTTSINVNLYNIQAMFGRTYYSEYLHTIIEPVKVDAKTTGNFEMAIENMVK
jgi:hypothetical protein